MTDPRLDVNEPVLPMDEIQGLVVPGFTKQHQTLLGIQFPDAPQSVRNFRKCLGTLTKQIATARETLDDRRRHRQLRLSKQERYPEKPSPVALTAVAFSYVGLSKLTPGAEAISSVAFREGLAARSAMLGDPTEATAEGNPSNWKVGAPGKELDCLFVVAGDTREIVDEKAGELAAQLKKCGADIVYREKGDVRDDLPGHEHFGFDDGVSQPGIRGRASEKTDDFITKRHISDESQPAAKLFGYPGQDLIWPGELLLGQPATSPDPLIPGINTGTVPEWTRNGSFLVFRRLRQDVGLFWQTMQTTSKDLSTKPGFSKLTDDRLAALIVGRWPSGAPVNRVPTGDDPDLGKEAQANNHFRFDSDAAALPLRSGYQDKFPMSKADSVGTTCPWAAHIRKVNTRDSASDHGGRDSTYKKRILRVGIPFGKPVKDRYADKAHDTEKGNRGLLFLCVQASIEDQFEFLVTRWMGDPSRPKTPAGHDILVGQNDAFGENRIRSCVLFGDGLQQAQINTSAQWIIPTGGGYFFVPSIRALREVLGDHA